MFGYGKIKAPEFKIEVRGDGSVRLLRLRCDIDSTTYATVKTCATANEAMEEIDRIKKRETVVSEVYVD